MCAQRSADSEITTGSRCLAAGDGSLLCVHCSFIHCLLGFSECCSPTCGLCAVFMVGSRLNGHEIAIDRATPKEDSRSSHSHSTALSAASKMGPNSRRSFDNGAGIVGPGLTPMLSYQQQLAQLLADPAAMAASLAGTMRLSEEQQRDFSNAAAELATSHFNAAAAAAAAACADFNAAAAAAAAEQAACCNGPNSAALLPPTTATLCGLGGATDTSCHAVDGQKSPTALDNAASANAAATAAAAAAMAAMAQNMPLPPLPGLPGLLGGLPPGMSPTALQNLTKAALFPGAPLGQFPLPGFAPPLGPPLGALPGADAFANPMFAGEGYNVDNMALCAEVSKVAALLDLFALTSVWQGAGWSSHAPCVGPVELSRVLCCRFQLFTA